MHLIGLHQYPGRFLLNMLAVQREVVMLILGLIQQPASLECLLHISVFHNTKVNLISVLRASLTVFFPALANKCIIHGHLFFQFSKELQLATSYNGRGFAVGSLPRLLATLRFFYMIAQVG